MGNFIAVIKKLIGICVQCSCVGNSVHGNRWSTITYRMALAVFCRSPAAYEALAGFDILQLPPVDS